MDLHPFLGGQSTEALDPFVFCESVAFAIFQMDHLRSPAMESILPLQNAEVETTRTFHNACQTIHEQPTAHPSFF